MSPKDKSHSASVRAGAEGPLPAPIAVKCDADLPELLSREWLLANRIGAYASSTVAAANTRRYHGLLVAAVRPPVQRVVALNCLMDQLVLPEGPGGERTFELSTFEFPGTFSPRAHCLAEFRNDVAACFIYRCGQAELVKEVLLAESANAVAVRYRITGAAGWLRIWPFLALRDYHELRRADRPHQMTYLHYHDGIRVEDRFASSHAVHISVTSAPTREAEGAEASRGRFHDSPQWWYRFRYRQDIQRGQEGLEDLYTPGWFHAEIVPGRPTQLTGSLDDPKEIHFEAGLQQKRRRQWRLVQAVGPEADELTRRLALASDVFVVSRRRPNAHPGKTILAGYHWFADWGRDAMVALPGLLLETGRRQEALQVLRTFADAMDEGMVPNCFDEGGGPPHFNSIDASLWFILAADRYASASGEGAGWPDGLAGPVDRILAAYHDGARFDIRADADGLLTGGNENTQLTWMDVLLGGRPVTPRHGKCVEINALWHAALRIAHRRGGDSKLAHWYGALADRVRAAFPATFWNEQAGCLYDRVSRGEKDASIRPNQILAVSLPECPLSADRQRRVVRIVQNELLTPYGLRTLSPNDPRYRGKYGISWESRDRAYHQGTVWPWLIGPFVEAYLKVHEFTQRALAQADRWLAAFDEHLREAGVGFVSEIFDGDAPRAPAGCIAQAWSIAEILRVKRLIAKGPPKR